MGLFDHPQPGTVFFAAAFGMLVGGMTAVGAFILGAAQPNGTIVRLVFVGQVVSVALLIGGGIALLLGNGGRIALMAGAVLNLVLCGWFEWNMLASDPEVPALLLTFPLIYAVIAGTSLLLASRRTTRMYLALPAVRQDLPPSVSADLGS